MAILGYDGLMRRRQYETVCSPQQSINTQGKQGREAVKIRTDYIRTGARPATADVLVSPVAITSKNLNNAERIELVK